MATRNGDRACRRLTASPMLGNLHSFPVSPFLGKRAPMANVISWPGDLASAAHACARLRSGQVGAIATEAGYEGLAFGLDGAAVAKLARLAMPDVPLAIALGSSREVFDWAPHLRGAGLRLA